MATPQDILLNRKKKPSKDTKNDAGDKKTKGKKKTLATWIEDKRNG